MTFLMRASPSQGNDAHPKGHYEIVDLVRLEEKNLRRAPQTEDEARVVVDEWKTRNNRWDYVYIGTEYKHQTRLKLEE